MCSGKLLFDRLDHARTVNRESDNELQELMKLSPSKCYAPFMLCAHPGII